MTSSLVASKQNLGEGMWPVVATDFVLENTDPHHESEGALYRLAASVNIAQCSPGHHSFQFIRRGMTAPNYLRLYVYRLVDALGKERLPFSGPRHAG